MAKSAQNTTTFAGNMRLPVHRWFRYSAGFSADWVRGVLQSARDEGRRRVLDPFAGSGTVLLEAESLGMDSAGVEAHPFVARVAAAKLLWRCPTEGFWRHYDAVRSAAVDPAAQAISPLLDRCYTPEALAQLRGLLAGWRSADDGSPASELVWLALVGGLRECSTAGTAQWQYVLPSHPKARVSLPEATFRRRAELMDADMRFRQQVPATGGVRLVRGDARVTPGVADGWAELIITSPPYANNYDYADAARLEMTFLGDVAGYGDLQSAVRGGLVRSCTQGVSGAEARSEAILSSVELSPISAELGDAYAALRSARLSHAGRKNYHAMIAAYFLDMARVLAGLRRAGAAGVRACLVVGDSAPYGVHVPVERWLGELALAAGFHAWRFEKVRGRNEKWLNRKHRVPLQEGLLWLEG